MAVLDNILEIIMESNLCNYLMIFNEDLSSHKNIH